MNHGNILEMQYQHHSCTFSSKQEPCFTIVRCGGIIFSFDYLAEAFDWLALRDRLIIIAAIAATV